MDAGERFSLSCLIHHHRWAALATQGKQGPEASWIAYAPEPAPGSFLLHLSDLSAHTRHLRQHRHASLAISERETPGQDPQRLARLSLIGEAEPLAKECDGYHQARDCYLARLPDAAMLFQFGDFQLFRFVAVQGRFVAGFGRAYRLTQDDLQQWPIPR